MSRTIKAPTGPNISCKGWIQEAAMRMLMNNLDPEVAELVVYGGSGKAARNWQAFDQIVHSLKKLEEDQTLLIQSGKPVGVIQSHPFAPRVIIANALLVPAWATWEKFRELERQGLTMYGQMTAGSWIYIGSQGILQGTYETFVEAGRQHFQGDLRGKFILSAGLGGMGGAQPLSATMAEAVFLGVEVNPQRIEKRIQTGYCMKSTDNLDQALDWVMQAKKDKKPLSVGLLANAADIYPELVRRQVIPDIVTDQTSSHDMLNGYIPSGLDVEQAAQLRQSDSDEYLKRAFQSVAVHVQAMLDLQKAGAVVFDYGNNIRTMAQKAGVENAFDFPGFVPAFIRPLFCQGKGPFRWAALSGDPEDIFQTDRAIKELFPRDKSLLHWLEMAQKQVHFQGLPCRICWLGYGDRVKAGLKFNQMVKSGQLKAPIVIGRDHLDTGSVASPYRETESMKDGSDAIADWPVLNALINAVNGASWVSVHHGGGVGIGYALHAGMVVVADGSELSEQKLSLVLQSDPGTGIIRHHDAGYQDATQVATEKGVLIPGLNY